MALAATSVTLFIASPLVAPLMLLGWGASIGGLIGAAAGATEGDGDKEGWLSDLVRDAIANGHVVLVADADGAGNDDGTGSHSGFGGRLQGYQCGANVSVR